MPVLYAQAGTVVRSASTQQVAQSNQPLVAKPDKTAQCPLSLVPTSQQLTDQFATPISQAPEKYGVTVLPVWSASLQVHHGTSMPWDYPPEKTSQLLTQFASADWQHTAQTLLPVDQAQLKVVNRETPLLGTDPHAIRESEYKLGQDALLTSVSPDINLSDGPYIPSAEIKIATFELVKLPAWNITIISKSLVHKAPDKERNVSLPWGAGQTYYERSTQPYEAEQPYLPGELTPSPDIKEVHILMHSVNVFALPGNEPLAAADVRMDIDQDAATWSFSCAILNEGSMNLIRPDESGNKEVAVEINGRRWEFFVDSYSDGKSISGNSLSKTYQINGFSRAQYLGEPFAPQRSRSLASTTAVQAAEDELSGTGFTLDWDTSLLPDWAMNNSSFSYQGLTPLQVIKRLAEVAGGVVQTDPATDTVIVRPRYVPEPWNLSGVVVDKSIHESQILGQGGQREFREKYNAVLVSGESEGVALTVTRNNTAGDNPAPDVVEAWLTAYDGNKNRGTQELCHGGNRMINTLEMAIPEMLEAEPGLLLPGMSVAVIYDDSALSYRGYVTAVSISAPGRGAARVRQSVTVERPVGWE